MPEFVEIPIAYFELVIEYERPYIKNLLDRSRIVESLFDALRPWDVGVDDIEVISEGKPSEQGIKFKIPRKQISFFFGSASCKLTKDGAGWDTAEETIQILDLAVSTLERASNIVLGSRKTTIALHLQPKSLPFIDILKPLISPRLAALENKPVKAMASIVKWDNRRITVDGSNQIANGIFLRFEREFNSTTGYQEIAKMLKADEGALFSMLDVQENMQ